MTLLVSKILMDLMDLIVKPSVDFRLCISKASLHVFLFTTKHVYCVTPCQLNRLLLSLVAIGLKIGKIKETNGFNRGNKSWFWDEMLT